MGVLEIPAMIISLVGVAYWFKRYARSEDVGNRRRLPVRPSEVALAGLVAANCVMMNAAAVAFVEPLSRRNLGPLALAYHQTQPPLALLPGVLLLLILATVMPGIGRASVIVFAGAATANIVSRMMRGGAVPDYIVVPRIDVIANLADVLMLAAGVILTVSVAHGVWRWAQARQRAARRGPQASRHA